MVFYAYPLFLLFNVYLHRVVQILTRDKKKSYIKLNIFYIIENILYTLKIKSNTLLLCKFKEKKNVAFFLLVLFQ